MSESESKPRFNAEEAKQKIKDACTGLIDQLCRAVPDDVATHLGNSKNEMLRAIRSLIDDEIARTDKSVDRVKEAKKDD